MSNNDALREALNELGSCQDDYNYLIGITENKDNLHGWFRMRTARVAGIRAGLAASTPEPQAQAREPAVVAVFHSDDDCGHVNLVPYYSGRTLQDGDELIIRQAFREAMADWQNSYFTLSCNAAKKDAALRACVEALKYHTEQTRPVLKTEQAIQQAQEALK